MTDNLNPSLDQPNQPGQPEKCCQPASQSPNDAPRLATRDEVDQSGYWDSIYQESENQSPFWNLGEVSPELRWRISHSNPPLKRGRLAVPGCGYGHDAVAFAEAGWEVTGFDFAPSALEGASEIVRQRGVACEFVQADVFSLPQNWSEAFDAVLEHTCYCAIHPDRRREYLDVMARVLRRGGEFFGLIYAHGREGGPPWHCDPTEFRELASPAFEVLAVETAMHSIERRAGKEVWVHLRRL